MYNEVLDFLDDGLNAPRTLPWCGRMTIGVTFANCRMLRSKNDQAGVASITISTTVVSPMTIAGSAQLRRPKSGWKCARPGTTGQDPLGSERWRFQVTGN